MRPSSVGAEEIIDMEKPKQGSMPAGAIAEHDSSYDESPHA